MPARERRKNAARGTRTGVIQPGSTPGASQDQDDDPLAMSPIRRKKRRRKEVIDSYGAGPSGWNGLSLELGEHGDLVPPSDDEEFEQWKSARVRGGEGVALVEEQDVEGRVTDQVIVGDQDSPHQVCTLFGSVNAEEIVDAVGTRFFA